MSKKWTFTGGMLAGIASVFTAATVAVCLEDTRAKDAILRDSEGNRWHDVPPHEEIEALPELNEPSDM